MRVCLWVVVVALLVCTLSPGAQAESVVQAWRGGTFSNPCSVSVNAAPADPSRPNQGGTCWVADRGGKVIVHLGYQDGTVVELWRGNGEWDGGCT